MSDQANLASGGDRIDELLALAALGELTAADERELDAALAADVQLQDELDADLDTAAHVQSVNAEAPSPELKQRVMAAIDAASAAPPAVDVPAAVVPEAVPSNPQIDELTERRERRRTRWLPMAAAAAVAFIAVAGVVIVRDGDSNGNDVVAEVMAAPDLQERPFDGELAGSLTAFYSPESDAVVVDGLDVESISEDQTYQLWLLADSGAESIGLFQPDDDGRVLVAFEGADPGDLPLGITIEPAGGSPVPSQAPVAQTV